MPRLFALADYWHNAIPATNADATDSNQSMALTSGREIKFNKSSNIPSAVSLNFKVFCGSIWILAIRCCSIHNHRRRS